MGTKRRTWFLATTAILAPLCILGCKENDPAPMLAQDLGTEGQPLVLPPSTFHNVAVNKGQADWVPFREPGAEPEPDHAQDVPAGDNQQADAETEDEIKAFIDDYNALSAEGDFEELQTYIVESQSQAIAAAFAAATEVRKKIDALKKLLSEQLSDQTDRVETTLAKLRVSADMATGTHLSTTSITVISADESTATNAPGSLTPTLKFVIIDDAWYLEFPELPDAETLAEKLSENVDRYDMVMARLSDGTFTAAQVLTTMEDALAAEAKLSAPQDAGMDHADMDHADMEHMDESDDTKEEDVHDNVKHDEDDAEDHNGNEGDD